jgi:hypothetical protein
MNTIFLGNGLNRLDSDYSWEHLLDELKLQSNLPSGLTFDGVPFPLLYEEIYLRSKFSANSLAQKDSSLRALVAEKCRHLKPNSLTRAALASGCPNIITTNYDYALEDDSKNLLKKSSDPESGPEIDYRIHTYNQCGDVRIWHIHGEANYPRTLVLGHDMYARNIGKMSAYVEKRGYDELFAQSNSIRENTVCWMDLFFNTDVHILGFSMEFSEIDVWWVINLRARLIKEMKTSGRPFPENKVYFHTRYRHLKKSFRELLESHYVEIVPDPDALSYYLHYRDVINKIGEK